jgi:tellurite methyltransferase
MASGDRERWNAKYQDAQVTEQPSAFLLSLDSILPRRGRALELAGGAGRNALWLAQRGLDVTLTDVSDAALERAAQAAEAGRTASGRLKLATLQIDLETEPFPAGRWQLVFCSYFLYRPLFAAIPQALAPGGLLVVIHPTRKNLERHPRPGPAFLLEDGELPGLVSGLEIVRSEEGWADSGRHEARLAARRPT